MATVSTVFVLRIIERLSDRVDRDMLCRVAGLDPSPSAGPPPAMIHAANYYSLLETIAETETPDIRFLLGVSMSATCSDFGAVGLAWKSAPTLRQSFLRMDRHARAYNTASTFKLYDKGDTFWWTHRRPDTPRLGLDLSSEGALATYVTLCREATGPNSKPGAVQFCHPEPAGSRELLEAHFRCPITFGADIDALIIPAERLDKPNLVGDESIWKFLSAQAEGMLPAESRDRQLDRQVVLQIADVLTDGIPSLAQVASDLGMSARTLQRRLSDQGLTFQALVDQARRETAERFLADTRYSIAEVAFLTGFSEQSAFTRAFKRWAGQTPGTYRDLTAAP